MLRSKIAPKKKQAWTGSVQKHNILISPNKIKCRAVSDADNDWRFKSNNCCFLSPNAASINNVNVTRRAVPSWNWSRFVWTERFLSLHLWLPVSHLYLWIHKSSERVWHTAKKSLLNCLNFLLPKRFNLRHWSDFLGRSEQRFCLARYLVVRIVCNVGSILLIVHNGINPRWVRFGCRWGGKKS